MADEVNVPTVTPNLAMIQSNLRYIDRAMAEVDKAKRAGIDTGDAEQRLLESRARLKRIKDVYHPNA